MSGRRSLAWVTVAAVARLEHQAPKSSSETGSSGRSPCGRDRHDVGGQTEVFEEVCGNAGFWIPNISHDGERDVVDAS